jgi:hypothetical protein
MRTITYHTKTSQVDDVSILVNDLNLSNLDAEITTYKEYDNCFYSNNPVKSITNFFEEYIIEKFAEFSPEFKTYWLESSYRNSNVYENITKTGIYQSISDSIGWFAFSYDDETTANSGISFSYNPYLKSKLFNTNLQANFQNGLTSVNALFFANNIKLTENLSVKDTNSSNSFSNVISEIYNYCQTEYEDLFNVLTVCTENIGDVEILSASYVYDVEGVETQVDFLLDEVLPLEKRMKLALLNTIKTDGKV